MFALIDYHNKNDAEDAVSSNDGVYMGGVQMEVEIFKPQIQGKPKNVQKIQEPAQKKARILRRSQSPKAPKTVPRSRRILVRELPKCATWQDLEDHFEAVGRVAHVEMFENREWITQSAHVEFERVEDVRRAIRMFHMTEFTSSKGATTVMRIRTVGKLKPVIPEKRKRQSSSRSRSPSRSPKRRRPSSSRSRSPHQSLRRYSSSPRHSSEPDVYIPKYEKPENPGFRVTLDGIAPSGTSEDLRNSEPTKNGIHVETFKSEDAADIKASKIQEAKSRSRSSESLEKFKQNPGILVRGLSKCATWQALKDHFRVVGNVEYVKVYDDTQSALVEFERDEDVQRAIRKFHLTKFTSWKGVTSEMHIREYGSSRPSTCVGRRRRSCSSRSSSRSPSRSPRRRASSSRSRSSSRSPRRRRAASSSRSHSRSPYRSPRSYRRRASSSSRSRSPRRRPTRRRASSSRSRSITPIRRRRQSSSRSRSPRRSPKRRRARSRSRSPCGSPLRPLSPQNPEPNPYIPLNTKLEKREFRVFVVGVPATCTREELQNHLRNFGPIIESFESGTSTVRFEKYKNMKKAIWKLDGAKFVSSNGETARLHLHEDKPIGPDGRRSRSRSYSRSRSPTPKYERRMSWDSDLPE